MKLPTIENDLKISGHGALMTSVTGDKSYSQAAFGDCHIRKQGSAKSQTAVFQGSNEDERTRQKPVVAVA